MSELSYVCSQEKHTLEYVTLHGVLDKVADELPEKEAHVFIEVSEEAKQRNAVTFRELADQSLQLAAGILKMGFEPGDRIGIIAANCPEWLYLDYALMRVKILMVRIPINFVYPGMLVPLLKKHNCKGLVLGGGSSDDILKKIDVSLPGIVSNTDAAIREHGLDSCLKHVMCLSLPSDSVFKTTSVADLIKLGGNRDDVIKIQKTICPDDPAVILPTSGSTGIPKFTLNSHFAVYNDLYVLLDKSFNFAQVGTEHVFFNDRPFSWLGGLPFGSVVFGCTVIHVNMSVTFGGEKTPIIYDIIEKERVTAAVALPYFLFDAIALKKSNIHLPKCLKYALTGGERIPEELLKFCQKEFTQTAVAYGLTECLLCTWGALTSATQNEETSSLFLTKLLPLVEMKVCDDDQNLVPKGEPGTLWIRSPYVTSGYIDQPEKTAAAKQPSGWFFTEDVAIVRGDRVEVIGRTRDVISKGMTKIYPKTIENVLYQHPDVDKAVVIGVPDPRFFNEICACVIIKKKNGLNGCIENQLTSFCKDSLLGDETSLVPKYFMFLDKLTYTSTGKIDRKPLIAAAIEKFNLA